MDRSKYLITAFWKRALPRFKVAHVFRADLEQVQRTPEAVPGYQLVFPWTPEIACDRGFQHQTAADDVCRHSENLVAARLHCGDLLGLALHDGKVTHRSLVQIRGTVATETARKAFTLRNKEAYIHCCDTDPGHRGKGLYSAMLKYIQAALSESGYRYTYISCSSTNMPSIRGILKAGFCYQYSERALLAFWERIRVAKRCDEGSLSAVSSRRSLSLNGSDRFE